MEVTITNTDNGVICKIAGSLDTLNATAFEESRKILEESADKKILLDCTELSYISSSGLRQFLSLRKTVEAKGGSLTLKGLNDDIRKVFTVTGFIRLFDIQ